MYSDGGALSDAGVCCIWRVLEAAAAAALNQRCRLLAAAGLPSRLVALCARARADLAAMQDAPRPRVSASEPTLLWTSAKPYCPQAGADKLLGARPFVRSLPDKSVGSIDAAAC